LSNYDNAQKFGYDNSFVDEKLGFRMLSRKGMNETAIDMCYKAYQDLSNNETIELEKIGLVVVVTQNPTYKVPHSSAILHNVLGLQKSCITFDISQGCSGYCHALMIMQSVMDSMNINTALLFTCDCYSEIINEDDKNVGMIFGDAASVTLLDKLRNGYIIKNSVFGTLPDSNDCLILRDFLRMDGRKVFQYACGEVPCSVMDLLDKTEKESVELYIFHPGTKFIVDSLVRLLELPEEKVEFSASEYGNTVSSSIPIQLSKYTGSKYKQKVIISGFGVGFTWGSCLLEYSQGLNKQI
jgi:3-oxoacyl-[acyl-carrier-protein] synthase-3